VIWEQSGQDGDGRAGNTRQSDGFLQVGDVRLGANLSSPLSQWNSQNQWSLGQLWGGIFSLERMLTIFSSAHCITLLPIFHRHRLNVSNSLFKKLRVEIYPELSQRPCRAHLKVGVHSHLTPSRTWRAGSDRGQ
jgi:hypothetical protein